MDRWYVFQSKPQQEFLAEWHLNRQQFITYVPFDFHDKKRLGVAYKQEKRALYKSYGFVRFDVLRDQWKRICSTYGVRRLFSTDIMHPIPVPVGIVENMIDIPVEEQEIVVEPIYPDDEVMVTDGPLIGQRGVCSYSDDELVTLLFKAMNSEIKITFQRNKVVKVQQGEN